MKSNMIWQHFWKSIEVKGTYLLNQDFLKGCQHQRGCDANLESGHAGGVGWVGAVVCSSGKQHFLAWIITFIQLKL